uniref:Uncharacterized protein n=1 Tax=Rhizophora mucronata TaxID=61149 RepID=A0A2P2PGP9_RHIMU
MLIGSNFCARFS